MSRIINLYKFNFKLLNLCFFKYLFVCCLLINKENFHFFLFLTFLSKLSLFINLGVYYIKKFLFSFLISVTFHFCIKTIYSIFFFISLSFLQRNKFNIHKHTFAYIYKERERNTKQFSLVIRRKINKCSRVFVCLFYF